MQILETNRKMINSDILELNDFKTRRVQMFRKSLIELTELQVKHAKVNN